MRGKEKTSHQSLTALQQRDWGTRVLRADESVTPFESVYTLAGLIPSLTMIRLTIYEQTPGWDESFGQPCEDTDLSLHVALQSEVRYLPEKLLLHRRHSVIVSGSIPARRLASSSVSPMATASRSLRPFPACAWWAVPRPHAHVCSSCLPYSLATFAQKKGHSR